MSDLPSMSIVVPNYNGGKTIGKTLQCLLDQGYPSLQLIVVDGASKDDSVEVIKQYEKHLHWWVSEKDSGQSQAINKGFAQCTGEVVNWLCSDDVLTPGALNIVGEHFAESPEIDIVAGSSEVVYLDDPTKNWLFAPKQEQIPLIPCHNPVAQPSCFYKRHLLRKPLPIDESFEWGMDFEMWAYFVSKGARWKCIDNCLSIYYNDGTNKTSIGGWRYAEDHIRIYRRYVKELVPMTFWQRRFRHPLQVFLMKHPKHPRARRVADRLHTVERWMGRFYGMPRVRALDWRHCVQPADLEGV